MQKHFPKKAHCRLAEMNAATQQIYMTSDDSATRLMNEMNRHALARDLIEERIRWLQKKKDYRTRKIRELAVKRDDVLNFKLPL